MTQTVPRPSPGRHRKPDGPVAAPTDYEPRHLRASDPDASVRTTPDEWQCTPAQAPGGFGGVE